MGKVCSTSKAAKASFRFDGRRSAGLRLFRAGGSDPWRSGRRRIDEQKAEFLLFLFNSGSSSTALGAVLCLKVDERQGEVLSDPEVGEEGVVARGGPNRRCGR
jgi:hypothetical protein